MPEIIIGVDHGNGNMKTANTVFPCGFTKQAVRPAGVFSRDSLLYKGNWYVLSNSRLPYTTDKTVDENCLILTLFAIAKELKAREEKRDPNFKWEDYQGFTGDVVLAAGLPPAHFEKQCAPFRSYFEEASGRSIEFNYNGKPFCFNITGIELYPQDYAAAVIYRDDLIRKYRTVYCVDIGDGTVDLLGLTDGMPDKNSMASREMGMARLREKIIDDVINDFSYTLDGNTIEDVLTPGRETVLDYDITSRIQQETAEWASLIINQLHAKVPDFRIAPTVFSGGGSILLKPYFEKSGAFGQTDFITDICANAIGYEMITEMLREEG